MTLKELAELVKEMRAAQRRYFCNRTFENLQAAKDLESKVDQAVGEILETQPRLFEP